MTMRRGAFCASIGWTAEGVPTCAPVCGGIERASWNGPCVDLAPTRIGGCGRAETSAPRSVSGRLPRSALIAKTLTFSNGWIFWFWPCVQNQQPVGGAP